jgi:transcriptional regulator with XRE-family HTH domain
MSILSNKNMLKFSERLKELRLSNNYTQQQMAQYLGVKQQSYARYENGTGQPSLEILIRITEIFDVSSDYLIGITEY